ncbi:MAG: SH3 domain-containing protein [Minisyncoccia bacterium]|jgi:hypothetical protein
MNKILRIASFGSIIFVVALSIFLLRPNRANASYIPNEYVRFRVDTELDQLNTHTVSIKWQCNGTGFGQITDNSASESDSSNLPRALDGIIQVASTSKEMTDAGCDATHLSLTATASVDGWVNRRWTDTILASTSLSPYAFTTRASMDYDITVTGVNDKLNYPLTLDGVLTSNQHASASYSSTPASSSYSGGKEYIAATAATSGGTVAASANGYLRRASTALTYSAIASTSVDFGLTIPGIVHATGLDYNLVVASIKDELDNTLVISKTTASASFSGTTASISYSGGKRYFAVTSGGTITAGDDGYVNEVSPAVSLAPYTDYSGASASLDFDSDIASTYDGTPLPFGHKIEVYKSGSTFNSGKLTSGTVVAGDGYGTVCTIGINSNAGYWYCPVTLSNTETLAKYSGTGLKTTTGIYTDRATGNDPQTLTVIAPESDYNGGGGGSSSGGGGYSYTPTPTPPFIILNTPTPIPLFTPTPTPTLTFTPLPTMTPPHIVVGRLYRTTGDPKVYVQNSDGTLTWVKSLAEFNAAGYSWKNVQIVTPSAFNQLSTSGITSGGITMQVTAGKLNIRSSASTIGKILGKLSAGQQVQILGKSGVWYEINYNGVTAWVNGIYLK